MSAASCRPCMSSTPFYLLLLLRLVFLAFADPSNNNSSCGGVDHCGDIVLPFPFHLNSTSFCGNSTGDGSSMFRLSCDGGRNSTLVLRLGAAAFRILGFLSSGSLLLDYALASGSTPCDPVYAALTRSSSSPAAALDSAARFLAVTPANVLRLYACEDSSLCSAGCDDVVASSCGKSTTTGCCYPLSDGSVWKPGDGLAVFAGFGCRGFSSWVKNRSSSSSPAPVMRGIEVEWALPRESALAACADGAVAVNASTVRAGVRCSCAATGLVGDGFALGTGCSKPTCSNNGGECCRGRFCSKKAVALAGFFVSVFFLAAAMSFWLFLRQPSDDYSRRPWNLDDPALCIPKLLAGIWRQFTYDQLEAAVKRYEEDSSEMAPVVGAVLDDGTVVSLQRIGYETPEKLRMVLELLPELSHRNITRVVGFCLNPSGSHHGMILVHEHFAGGTTLEDHLRGLRCPVDLTWNHRVNIAIELASALTYLLHMSPTFLLHDLRSSDIFLDTDLSAKIAGYKLAETSSTYYGHHHAAVAEQDVVRNYGHLLMELVTGLRQQQELVLDPTLQVASGEEVRKVVEVAVRCVETGGCMVEVARELMKAVVRDDDMGISSSNFEISLEETFSSSSLLQMISMSPDTLQRHLP